MPENQEKQYCRYRYSLTADLCQYNPSDSTDCNHPDNTKGYQCSLAQSQPSCTPEPIMARERNAMLMGLDNHFS